MEDVEVNQKDLEEVEKTVVSNQKKLEEEIKSKLKKEMEQEQKQKEEKERLLKLEEEKAAMERILKEKEEEFQKKESELKSQIGQSKAIHNMDNQTPPKKEMSGAEFVKNLTPEQVKEIDEASLDAFLAKNGLTRSQWRGR